MNETNGRIEAQNEAEARQRGYPNHISMCHEKGDIRNFGRSAVSPEITDGPFGPTSCTFVAGSLKQDRDLRAIVTALVRRCPNPDGMLSRIEVERLIYKVLGPEVGLRDEMGDEIPF